MSFFTVLLLAAVSDAVLAQDKDTSNHTWVTIGGTNMWQYSYFPNTTCINCTVTVQKKSPLPYVVDVYLILHGSVSIGQSTASNMEIYLDSSPEPIGTLYDLAVDYNSTGELEPLFSSGNSSSINFENYYAEEMVSNFPQTIELFFRLRDTSVDCGVPLVYSLEADDTIVLLPQRNPGLEEHCFATVFSSEYDVHPKLTLYDWSFQGADALVAVVPGYDDIPFGQQYDFVAANVTRANVKNFEDLRITTPGVNLFLSGSSNVSVKITNKQPVDYNADKFLAAGMSGFLMGTYPDYCELQAFSKFGKQISVEVSFPVIRLSNTSKIAITSGKEGRIVQEFRSDADGSTVSFKAEQFNIKFTPSTDTQALFVALYTVSGSELPRLSVIVLFLALMRWLVRL